MLLVKARTGKAGTSAICAIINKSCTNHDLLSTTQSQVMTFSVRLSHRSWPSQYDSVTGHDLLSTTQSQVMTFSVRLSHRSWPSQYDSVTGHDLLSTTQSQVMTFSVRLSHRSWFPLHIIPIHIVLSPFSNFAKVSKTVHNVLNIVNLKWNYIKI